MEMSRLFADATDTVCAGKAEILDEFFDRSTNEIKEEATHKFITFYKCTH